MIFNSQPNINNLLEGSYAQGNLLFHNDILLAPVANSVKITDLRKNTSRLLPLANPHTNAIIALTPDGSILLAIDYSGHATLFNLQGDFTIGEFNFKGPVRCATFSQDGKLLGIGQEKGFTVYESSSLYRCFQPLILIKKYKTRHSANICYLDFSKDSRFLVSCGQDHVIYINNLFPINGYMAISLQAHRYRIVSTAFSHDMNYLYSIDSGSNLLVWKWISQTTQKYDNFKAARKRVRNNIKGQSVQGKDQEGLSEFQQRITQGRFIIAKKHSINQGGFLKRAVFKAQMGFLACTHTNGKFSIWRLIDEDLEAVQSFSVGQHKISTIAVNPSCTWLALGVKQLGQLIVWEWRSQSYILNQRGFAHETRQIAYNTANLYATGTNQGIIRLWDANSFFCIASMSDHLAAVTGLKFTNINTLFSSSLDGTVNAYDIPKQKKFRVFRPDASCQLVCLELDNNGEVLFAGAFDPYEIYSWNVQTGHLLQIVSGHQGPLACLTFAKDSLISASWDNTVRIHAIFARKLNVQTLQHGSEVTAMALHPSETQFAVATMKGQIYLWQIETGNMIGVLHSQLSSGRSYLSKISSQNDPSTKYLKCLAYSPCGNYLYGGGKSKYLYVFDINHRMLISRIPLTSNKDIQGVVDKLNSKYIKNGVPTYEFQIQQQNQVYSQDEKKGNKLPGSKQIDISEIRLKLEVEVKRIIVRNSNQLMVTTSFGTLRITNQGHHSVFNPYQLAPNLQPTLVPTLLKQQEYTSAVLVTLKLHLNARKLVKKIPLQFAKAVISELEVEWGTLLMERLCEEGRVSGRQLVWVQGLLESGVAPVGGLRGALEGMEEQGRVLDRTLGTLEMVELMGVDE